MIMRSLCGAEYLHQQVEVPLFGTDERIPPQTKSGGVGGSVLYTDLRPVHEQQPHQRLRTRCAAAMVDNTNARTLPMVNEAPVCMLILVALVFFFRTSAMRCNMCCARKRVSVWFM